MDDNFVSRIQCNHHPDDGMAQQIFRQEALYDSFHISVYSESPSAVWPAESCFRVLQGIGGGALQTCRSLYFETFAKHGMAMAIFGVGIMFGPIIAAEADH
jgi:hypothetical protein